jgi:hypothetical protein
MHFITTVTADDVADATQRALAQASHSGYRNVGVWAQQQLRDNEWRIIIAADDPPETVPLA